MGIRAVFAVGEGSASAVAPDKAAALKKATETYRAYIDGQLQALIPATQEFADAVVAGDLEKAKSLFPSARAAYERIEPVAEAFADDDYKIDIREDGIEAGKPWTGWHAIEKILWVDNTTKGADTLAPQLVADTKVLAGKAATLEITPSMIGNGASGLMTEVATGKITGEEDRYSHTDISDFVANVEGVKAAFQSLEQVATTLGRGARPGHRHQAERSGGRAGQAEEGGRHLPALHRPHQGADPDPLGQRRRRVRADLAADGDGRRLIVAPAGRVPPAGQGVMR